MTGKSCVPRHMLQAKAPVTTRTYNPRPHGCTPCRYLTNGPELEQGYRLPDEVLGAGHAARALPQDMFRESGPLLCGIVEAMPCSHAINCPSTKHSAQPIEAGIAGRPYVSRTARALLFSRGQEQLPANSVLQCMRMSSNRLRRTLYLHADDKRSWPQWPRLPGSLKLLRLVGEHIRIWEPAVPLTRCRSAPVCRTLPHSNLRVIVVTVLLGVCTQP